MRLDAICTTVVQVLDVWGNHDYDIAYLGCKAVRYLSLNPGNKTMLKQAGAAEAVRKALENPFKADLITTTFSSL
jgi:hypothetical protein